MSEEHGKLIAKIQHFYDILAQRIHDKEIQSVGSAHSFPVMSAQETLEELHGIIADYTRVFEGFIYKEE